MPANGLESLRPALRHFIYLALLITQKAALTQKKNLNEILGPTLTKPNVVKV